MNREIKRKSVHALGITSIALIYLFGKLFASLIMLGVSLSFLIFEEYIKNKEKYKLVKIKKIDEIEEAVEDELKSFERSKEKPFHGAITFYMGCFISTFIFPMNIAIASIAVLSLADATSTLVGFFFGKRKNPLNRKKTIEGSAMFFVTALLVLWFFTDPIRAVAFSVMLAFVEMLPKVDDNLTIPIATGLLLFLI